MMRVQHLSIVLIVLLIQSSSLLAVPTFQVYSPGAVAGDQPGDQEAGVALLAGVEDLDNAGVLQAGDAACLFHEGLALSGGEQPVRARHLDRHRPLQDRIKGTPDLAERSFPE